MSERQSPCSFMRRESKGEADSVRKAVTAWRARAIRILLIVVAILGLPAWGAVILNGIRSGQMTPLLWVYLLAYLSILALAFLPHLDYRLRIWGLLLAGYVNGAASLARLGLDGSGRPAREIRAAVLDELAGFVGDMPQADDITLLVLTYTGPADR